MSWPPEWTRTLSVPTIELHAAGLELGDDRAKMLRVAGVDVQVATGDGAGDEEGAGLDAVGVDAVTRSVELGNALDLDGGGACALDLRSHGVEQRGEIGNLRLACTVLEEQTLAVRERRGHQQVFGSCDSDLVEDDMCSAWRPLDWLRASR